MLETLIALIMLCLLFFGAMQIFQWAFARMFCDYSSFYAAKAFSLGYAYRTISKVARVAAIPISTDTLCCSSRQEFCPHRHFQAIRPETYRDST